MRIWCVCKSNKRQKSKRVLVADDYEAVNVGVSEDDSGSAKAFRMVI